MRDQHAIDEFTLAFHRAAIPRLREQAELLLRAKATLERWRIQRGSRRSDPYLDTWSSLVDQGPDAIERAVCAPTADAATLRNASPLGFVLSARERADLHKRTVA